MTIDPHDLLARIEALLVSGNYEWARETLEGISRTVRETGRASLRQEEAVTHIIVGRLKHDVGPI